MMMIRTNDIHDVLAAKECVGIAHLYKEWSTAVLADRVLLFLSVMVQQAVGARVEGE